MPVPRAPPSTWAHDDPSRLESLVRAPSTPHAVALRCQCILRAAGSDGPSPLHVAPAWPGHRPPVRRWRPRSLAPGLPGLQEAPRSGRPRRFAPLSAAGGEGAGHAAPCAATRGRRSAPGAEVAPAAGACWPRQPAPPSVGAMGSTAPLRTSRRPRTPSGPDSARPCAAWRPRVWAAAPLPSRAGRGCHGRPRRRPWPLAHRSTARLRPSGLRGGPASPRGASPPGQAAGLWARRAPVPRWPPRWPLVSPPSQRGSARTGGWRTSRPPGAWRAAAWAPRGARGRAGPRRHGAGHSGAPSAALPPIRLAAPVPPHTAHGATTWHGGGASAPVGCSHAVLAMRPTM